MYNELCQLARDAALLESIESLLNWDERTYLPAHAGAYRAEQITHIAGLVHRQRTNPRWGELLAKLADTELAADLHSDSGTTIRQLKRDYDKRCKLPNELVEALARAAVLGQQAWVEARPKNDFKSFAPHLETLYRLKREQAAAIGYEQNPYDALLDDFEPQAKTAEVAKVLAELRQQLVPLVQGVAESKRRPKAEILNRSYPVAVQQQFGQAAAAAIGFDFNRGRLDVTHHPFCSGMGPHDCRITTRYHENFFPSGFFGILHEAGHGIYDQGLRPEQYGLPPGSYLSLGIHESQSRMWENLVGRSQAFWQYFYPKLQQAFPTAVGQESLDDFYFAINNVQPSLIRVEADEATYNLHINVRFELEQAVLNDELAIAELPTAWREKYRHYLGIEPPNDSDGVLQDVHWSAALIGYFPTYSLGNLYASQFYEQADRDLGGLEAQFARGEFQPLREWLRTNIHARGQCYSAAELVKLVTGKELSPQPLMRHLRGKFGRLFDVN